jgi:hypothetical protein
MRVNQGYAVTPYEPAQGENGANVPGTTHAHRLGRQARRPGFGQQPTGRLAGDERAPAVIEQPARLG